MPSSFLSRACEYGLRASLYLASLDRKSHVPIREIADALEISGAFLTKILQQLTAAGIMKSLRGASGGVAFARPLERITIKDLIVAIDGPEVFTECVLGLPGCGVSKPCPFHHRWAVERDRLNALFSSTTLAEMAANIHTFDVRLKPLP
jgi:Rrf2 family transcriptional regulator, iron-sulfur cluster assembly transcription factor